jgi:hypothetical protein
LCCQSGLQKGCAANGHFWYFSSKFNFHGKTLSFVVAKALVNEIKVKNFCHIINDIVMSFISVKLIVSKIKVNDLIPLS